MNSKDPTPVNRRQFIRLIALGSASLPAGSALLQQTLRADIGAEFASTTGTLRLRLTDFPALAENGGSVRISVNPLRSNHQPDGTFHPILVNRLDTGALVALSSECSHASCAVRTYNPSANAHICPCHNSRFAMDGRRLSGPAPFGLESFPLTLTDDETIEIEVPRLGFTVNGCLETSHPDAPLKLEFPARRSVTYQVVAKSDVTADWEIIPFGLTADGPYEQDELEGANTFAALFVPRPATHAFVAVQIKVQTV